MFLIDNAKETITIEKLDVVIIVFLEYITLGLSYPFSYYYIQITVKSSTDETTTIPPLVVPVIAAPLITETASLTLFSSTIDITVVLVEYAIFCIPDPLP